MRRPLCVFCIGTLGLELVCAFLPQMGLFVPFAAFFAAGLLFAAAGRLCRKPAWGYGICLVLGAALGLCLTANTRARLERLTTAYDGRTLLLEAEVEQVSSSWSADAVRAVLRVEQAAGEPVSFRVECARLPVCEAGDRLRGRFALEAPAVSGQQDLYADGVVLTAEAVEDPVPLGGSRSFRARTARLQKRLSAALRQGMAAGPAGVLAAMVTGDRTHLSSALRTAYRGAGLSHVLVVSGMHVSILCGDVLGQLLPRKKKKLCSYASRRLRALTGGAMALLLVGVTGCTPSVLRAAGAVWLSGLGVWVYGPSDALTSLGVAGVLMTAGNSYAVCDIGFELSFAAVVGTLAGSAVVRRSREVWAARRAEKKRPRSGIRKQRALGILSGVWETACISACASMATFPVLVLRGMSASLYALVSGVAVLWLVEPILLTGLAAAQLWFDTGYAAAVCLLLAGLCWLAFHSRVRLRVALPALLVTAAVAISTGNALSRDVVHLELVGSRNAPAAVLSRNDRAVILFRGGETTENAVKAVLERRNIRTVECLVDLRTAPEYLRRMGAENFLAADRMQPCTTRRARCSMAEVEVLRTQSGCIVRVQAAGQTFVTLSGSVKLTRPVRADWLLASASRPDAVQYRNVLTLSTRYRWMDAENTETEWETVDALSYRVPKAGDSE